MTNEAPVIEVMPWETQEDFLLHDAPAAPEPQAGYDLEERTAKFGEAIIEFCKRIPASPRTNRLIDQLTGCGTSVGANYCEADDAVSKKEFASIIGTCRKEARETKFFLRMIATACPELRPQARILWLEAHELHLIFSRIRHTTLKNLKPS